MKLARTLVNELEAKIAEQIQDEMDWAIMKDLCLADTDYKLVRLKGLEKLSELKYLEILEWCQNHLAQHFLGHGKEWLFESEKDATMFILKWSS
jgi:hypothetical protein